MIKILQYGEGNFLRTFVDVYFDTLNKKYKKRFQMKGGITGLAQCKGRNENSWEEKVTLDNEYIDRFKTAYATIIFDLYA